MPLLKIPSLYSHYTNKQKEIQLEGKTIEEVFTNLYRLYPAIKKHLVGADGQKRRHINIFINKIKITEPDQNQTTVQDQDEIILLPNISGG